jgi:hypothetical protein
MKIGKTYFKVYSHLNFSVPFIYKGIISKANKEYSTELDTDNPDYLHFAADCGLEPYPPFLYI